jgi:apolipoprotein N-acyltransferase
VNKALLLPILTGLFIGTSYIPFPPWAMLFGIAPLAVAIVQLYRTSLVGDRPLSKLLWRGFFFGWLAQFILNAIGFHWISITAVEFGHFPKWAGFLTLMGFCSIAHIYYGLAAMLTLKAAFWINSRKAQGAATAEWVIVALYFTSFAFIEALWPSIFPWHLGYPWLWAQLPGAQFSDVIGFEGLNLVTLLSNALFTIGWLAWKKDAPTLFARLRPTLKWLIGGLAVFAAVNLLGAGREKPWQQTNAELNFVIAQGNIGNYEKLIVEKQKEFSVPIIEGYLKLSAQGFEKHPKATFALWPETAYPDYLDQVFQNEKNWIALRGFAQIQGRMILTGAYSYDTEVKKSFNGFFAMSKEGALLGPPYRKSILIPFGEHFPFSGIIPYTKWLFPGLGSFGQGPGPSVMELGEFRLGPQICLESLYPTFSAQMALKGAEVFSNVTNDSWFGKTFEPYQHLAMTKARAVENRRPLLRATNTGITTVVLADGHQLEQSPIGEEWVGAYTVPYIKNPPVALYSKIAGYSWWLMLSLWMLLVAFAKLRYSKSPI